MNQAVYESLSKKAAQLMPKDRLNPYDYSLYMKILAELIVRECISKYEELEDAVVIYRLGGERTGEIAKSELIKEYFGVRE